MSPLSKSEMYMSPAVILRLLPSHALGAAVLPGPDAAPGPALLMSPLIVATPDPLEPLVCAPSGDDSPSPEQAATVERPAATVQASPTLTIEVCIRFMRGPSRWRQTAALPNDGARARDR